MPASETRCFDSQSMALMMDTAENVLENMYFDVVKKDAEAGYIRTRALSGAQIFQFWRSENVGTYNTGESNIHSLQRTVELEFKPNNGSVCVDCAVYIRRLSMPQAHVSGVTRLPGVYTGGNSEIQEVLLHHSRDRDIQWVDMGRDGNLERLILDRIRKKSGRAKQLSMAEPAK